MLPSVKPIIVLSFIVAPFILAACQTTGTKACSDRGLQPDTPEYQQCVDAEYAKVMQRVRSRAHRPGGGGGGGN